MGISDLFAQTSAQHAVLQLRAPARSVPTMLAAITIITVALMWLRLTYAWWPDGFRMRLAPVTVARERRLCALGVLAAAALWVAYGTTPRLVALPTPAAGIGGWLGLSGAIIALSVQGALSLLGLQVYCAVVLRQLGLERLGWPARLGASIVGVCAAVCGWEVFGWPAPFVVCAELALAGLMPLYLLAAREQRIGRFAPRLPAVLPAWLPLPAWRPGQARFRAWVVVVHLTFGLTLAAIWLRHFTSWYATALFGLFALICVGDDILVSLLALCDWSESVTERRKRRGTHYTEMLHPHRWHITVPAMLGITYLGAFVWLAHASQSDGISATTWIEAGTAGAIFLLFRGTADLGRRDRYHRGRPLLERELAERESSHAIKRAAVEFHRLRFGAAYFVLAATYLFHWLYTSTDLHALLVIDMGTVVFAVSALIVAVLSIVVNKVHLEMSGLVAGEMFIIMLACTGIAMLLMYVRQANPVPITLPGVHGATVAALLTGTQSPWLVAHAMAAEALFLITICLVAYLYHVIRVAQHIRSAPPERAS